MSEQIPPALSAGQWAALRLEGGGASARVREDGSLAAEGSFHGGQRRALAALALHEQPFGFTWNDVAMIRSTVLADDLHSPDDWFVLQRLGERIAALLPPRDDAGVEKR